jgi:amino acid transporter
VEGTTITPPETADGTAEPSLRTGVLGFASNVVISTASVAPAYSIAATLGFLVALTGVGVHAPAVMIVSFIPMLLIASAYKYLNKAEPDAGTSFTWVTRAMGPHIGWMAGWAIVLADVIVMASLAQIAGLYTFLLFGWDSAANSTTAIIIAAVLWIGLMTWICYRGIELSARTQQVLLTLEVFTLTLFAVVALVKVYANNPVGSIHPRLEWFNPFGVSSSGALVDGVLLGLFIYWGWDSGVAVNEESVDRHNAPGSAAVLSTVLLVLIYVVVCTAGQAFHGIGFIANQDDVLNKLGKPVLGSGLDKLLILCVLTSASASTQTTILPTARTTLSMARQGAIPRAFARIHPRFQIPTVSTLLMGGVSMVWTIVILAFDKSGNVLADCIVALGFSIAFYYGLTGYACAIFYRHDLFRNVKNFLFLGLFPVIGGVMLTYIFIKAMVFYGHGANDSAGDIFGIGTPVFVGIGGLLLGVVLMIVSMPKYRLFFRQKPVAAPPGFDA